MHTRFRRLRPDEDPGDVAAYSIIVMEVGLEPAHK